MGNVGLSYQRHKIIVFWGKLSYTRHNQTKQVYWCAIVTLVLNNVSRLCVSTEWIKERHWIQVSPALFLLLFFFFFLFLTHGAGAADYSANHYRCSEASSHLEKAWNLSHGKRCLQGSQKKSDRQLRQADYNQLQPRIHGMVKLSYIWPFLGLLIVHRTEGKIIVQIR